MVDYLSAEVLLQQAFLIRASVSFVCRILSRYDNTVVFGFYMARPVLELLLLRPRPDYRCSVGGGVLP